MGKRADILAVEKGLLASRSRAQLEIAAGHLLADGEVVRKPGQRLGEEAILELVGQVHPWVARSGEKLAHAIEQFALDFDGRSILDLGASTGGFTEVSLANGARHVTAVDVGRDQLHPSLRSDERVSVIEGRNVKDLLDADLERPAEIIVCDLSFISLKKALPPVLALAEEGATLIALVKPQFEVGRDRLGKGGIVKDPDLHQEICRDISDWIERDMHWQLVGLTESPILGGDGNREFLLVAKNGG